MSGMGYQVPIFWDEIRQMKANADTIVRSVAGSVTGFTAPPPSTPICPTTGPYAALVCPFSDVVRFNIRGGFDSQFRENRSASGTYHGLNWTESRSLSALVWHEARHCWQFHQPDVDRDGLPDSVTDVMASQAVVDSPNIERSGGINPEFDFLGSGFPPASADTGFANADPSGMVLESEAVERDAMRWESRNGIASLDGALDCVEAVFGTPVPNLGYPLVDLGNLKLGRYVNLLTVFAKDSHSTPVSGVRVWAQRETASLPGSQEPGNPDARVLDPRDNEPKTNALGIAAEGGLATFTLDIAEGLNIFTVIAKGPDALGNGGGALAYPCGAGFLPGPIYFEVRGHR